MRQKNILKGVLLTIILTAAFLLLRTSVTGTKTTPEPESMEECNNHKNEEGTPKMGWESLPHQFFSSF